MSRREHLDKLTCPGPNKYPGRGGQKELESVAGNKNKAFQYVAEMRMLCTNKQCREKFWKTKYDYRKENSA